MLFGGLGNLGNSPARAALLFPDSLIFPSFGLLFGPISETPPGTSHLLLLGQRIPVQIMSLFEHHPSTMHAGLAVTLDLTVVPPSIFGVQEWYEHVAAVLNLKPIPLRNALRLTSG